MVLGTAQLGMPYGIARRGTPDKAEGLDMLRRAIVEGVTHLDTARAYGESEALIGALHARGWEGRMRVVTKLSPMDEVAGDADPAEACAQAENSLLHSCLALRSDRLDCVLLHRAAHLDAWNGAMCRTLESWQAEGRIGKLGVSVQSPEELYAALEHNEVGHVQLPCNILDHRWDGIADAIRSARHDRGLVVHVRSALLQGLLGNNNPNLWRRAHVPDTGPVTSWLARKAASLGRESAVVLCLAWARGLDWADGIVVGCDSLD
jgi:spore coat polysaccharide biosynthesis protein SpsF